MCFFVVLLEEELLDGNHIVISVELNNGVSCLPTHALVDCGATGYAFADEEFTIFPCSS